jgi:hypothetical protein
MKSKLSVVLAAAGCLLAVSPANAISVTTHRGVTTTSVPGAVLFDDFDSIQNTAMGTITGGLLCSGGDFGCGGLFGTPPATGNFLGVNSVDGTTTIATVTFTNPVSYAGFAWGTPDDSNEVDVYDGSTLGPPGAPKNSTQRERNMRPRHERGHADSLSRSAATILPACPGVPIQRSPPICEAGASSSSAAAANISAR